MPHPTFTRLSVCHQSRLRHVVTLTLSLSCRRCGQLKQLPRQRRRRQCSLIHLPRVRPTIHLAVSSSPAASLFPSVYQRIFHLSSAAAAVAAAAAAVVGIFQLAERRMPLIIYSLIHRRHDRLGGGRVVGRTNVDGERGLDSLRSDIVSPGKNPSASSDHCVPGPARGRDSAAATLLGTRPASRPRRKAAGYDHRRDNLSRRPSDSGGRLSSKVEMRQCDNVVVYRRRRGRPTGPAGKPM